MADTPTPTNKSSIGFLGRKIGPLPVWAWGAIGFGAYWWYTHYGPGSKPAAAPAAPAAPRPEIIDIRGQRGARGARGARGVRGPRGYEGVWRRYGSPPPTRGTSPPVTAPVQAAAPMTGGDIYGNGVTANPAGQTYDSGDVVNTMGAAYAVAG